MLAEVGVEAQRTVLLPLDQAFTLQKVNRENRGVTTVTAPERQSAISEICKRSDLTPGGRHDFGLPSNICVSHGNRTAAMFAPSVGLQIRQVRIPGDVNPWYGI